MSRAEAVQCTLDIKSWFSRTECGPNMNNGASSVDFQRLEKTMDTELPSALRVVLSEINGGIYFMEKRQMSTDDIADCFAKVERSKKWEAGLIPFCGDEDTMLVIDTQHDYKVHEWDSSDGLGDQVSSTLERFLEDYRNDLLSGHFEFLEDVGVIEKMGKAASKK